MRAHRAGLDRKTEGSRGRMPAKIALAAAFALSALVGPQSARAQASDGTEGAAFELPAGFEGPPPPVAPDVISRDDRGRVTLRAIRLGEAVVVDGRLDESLYASVPPIGDFVQQEPREGDPATEKTEAWVFFDDRNLYIAARLWDSHPERMVANEMRRDNFNITEGESLAVVLDTFYDRRNGFFFETNPLGALRDGLITDERDLNTDWNTVWEPRVTRFEQGWVVEMAIPFKSLRYNSGTTQAWGINLRRTIKWKNEEAFLSAVPASWQFRGIRKFSSAATLVGIEPPLSSVNLEIKPYVLSGLETNTLATPSFSNDWTGGVGFDGKYGLTKGLTADFTVNTDFAQVEADDEQVNLTRFSLFFPEKREFFLEGQGIFNFGGAGSSFTFGPPSDTPLLFFSRRIGIASGEPLPIRAGARATGRAGAYTVGALNIQTGSDAALQANSTNFSVLRLRRDILRRSTVGVIATNRSVAVDGSGSNQAFGVDGNFSFLENLNISTYYAETRTPGRTGNEASYLAKVVNNGDRYGFEYEHLMVGDGFNPEIGFVRRSDFRLNRGQLRFSPRPASIEAVRKFTFQGGLNYFTDLEGVLETRELQGEFGAEFQSGDEWSVEYARNYEYLAEPFAIASDVTIPVGGYNFQDVRTSYRIGPQRRISGRASFSKGSFFSGNRTEVSYDGRVEVTPQLSIEPRIEINWVDLAEGSFTAKLYGSRVTYTASPRMFVGALVQYNSSVDSVGVNVRFRWEYKPGSDLFIVYSEGRDTTARGFPLLQNRGLVVKYTRLFRF